MKVGVLTISDRSAQGEREDISGPAIVEQLRRAGWEVEQTGIVSDDKGEVEAALRDWCDSEELDLILTSGGTGFSPRDLAPEATLAVCDRLAPGLAEAMRAASLQITPHGMLSRAVAGIRGRTLIVNLPGSPRAARENLAVIFPVLPHAIDLLQSSEQAEAGHRIPPKELNA